MTAIVVPTDGSAVTAADLIEFGLADIAHFKAPKSVVLQSELPRSATGKLLKRTRREQLTGNAEAVTR